MLRRLEVFATGKKLCETRFSLFSFQHFESRFRMSNLETSNPETNHETNNNISPPGSHEKIPVDNGTTTVVDIHQPAMATVAPNKQPTQIDKEKPKDVPSKPSLAEKLKSMLPTYNQFKKTLKADIGLTAALVLVLDQTTNESIGQGTLLASIAMVFFCPVKPIGLQFEVGHGRVNGWADAIF